MSRVYCDMYRHVCTDSIGTPPRRRNKSCPQILWGNDIWNCHPVTMCMFRHYGKVMTSIGFVFRIAFLKITTKKKKKKKRIALVGVSKKITPNCRIFFYKNAFFALKKHYVWRIFTCIALCAGANVVLQRFQCARSGVLTRARVAGIVFGDFA